MTPVRLWGGAFSEKLELPSGDGEYSIEICAGEDESSLTTVNALLVDTGSPPRKAIR